VTNMELLSRTGQRRLQDTDDDDDDEGRINFSVALSPKTTKTKLKQ